MEIIPKLNLNRNPKDIPTNSIVAAKNVVIDDTGSYITNENGFRIAFDCPNEHEFICGVIPTNKELVIFTYDTESKKSRIYRYKDDSSYECNIGWTYSGGTITGSYTYNYKGELIIAVGEYNAYDKDGSLIQVPFKCWNVDNCIPISHNQEEEIGNINASYSIVPGNLVCGTYTFFIRFAINDYDYTKWFQITPEIIIIDEVSKEVPTHTYLLNDAVATLLTGGKFENFKVNTNKISDKGITLDVTIPDKFNRYQIGYIIKHDEEVLGRIQNTYDANVTNITINNNIYVEEESIDELTKSPNQFYNVKNVINYNNRIYISNYEEYKNENISVDAKVTIKNKEITSDTKTIDTTSVNCQLYFRNNFDGIASIFSITNVVKHSDDVYIVNNINQFISNYFANNIKLYNNKGESITIVNSKDIELTEEGKQMYRSCKEDYTLCICDKNKDPRYTFIYSSKTKTVSNINSIYFKKEDNNWKLYINVNFNDGTYDINVDNIFYNVLIESTMYLTKDYAAQVGESYFTPFYANHFVGEDVRNGQYNGHYPKGGFDITGSITINNYSYSYDNNTQISRSLIPIQKYNIFIHYIRTDGSYTNGYFVNTISSDKLSNINYIEFNTKSIPVEYIGYFYSYEDVEYNAIPVLGIESTNNSNVYDDKFTNTDFIYNENNIYGDSINGFKFDNDIIGKKYNKKATSTANVEVLNAKNNVTIRDKYIFTSNNNSLYNKKVKTLYRLTSNQYKLGTISETDYLPNFYNKEKVIVFTESLDNTKLKDLIFNPTTSKVVTDKGSETGYDIWLYDDYNYSINPLDAYSIKQDYSKGAVSLINSTGVALGTFYNSIITPDKLHDLLEIKSAYTSKPVKSYTNYSKDYIDKFNKTIYRSNIISDESAVNGFKDFNTKEYKIIKENKGEITNIVGIGLYLLIHTQYSLFVFDRTPKLTQTSQLQIPDTFDIDYQEVLPSNEGFGGLSNKEESIISKNGYIWYDKVNKYIFKYENGKCEVLSSDINNFIKDVNIDTIRFGEDLETNRLLICIYITADDKTKTITISYNFNTKTFISLHDYAFTNCYRTYNQAYFFNTNKDSSRLYVFDKDEHGYRNLSSHKDGLYFPTYENAKEVDDSSESKPDFPVGIPAITKAYIRGRRAIDIYFDLKIIEEFNYYRIAFKKGSNDYIITNGVRLNKDSTVQHFESDNSLEFYDAAEESKTLSYSEYKLYCILYETEDDANNKKNGHITNEMTFNDDVRTEILDAITIFHNDVIKDGTYTIHDYIDFTKVSALVFPLEYQVSTSSVSQGVEALGKIDLPTNTDYEVTITILGSKDKKTIGVYHPSSEFFKNLIVTRQNDNIVLTDNIDVTSTRKYDICLLRNGLAISESTISFETNTKGYIFEITNKIANGLDITCTMNEVKYKYNIKIEDGIFNPIIYHSNIGKITITKNDSNDNTKTYYSIDDGEYKEYDYSKSPEIVLEDKQNIKAYNVYTENDKEYSSKTVEYTFYKDIKNAIELLAYDKVEATNIVLKNYVDIIYCRDIESTKSLESIQYILDIINNPFGTINIAEQAFARLENHKDGRYSGDYLVLYSDETYSGQIDINDKGNNNIMDNYKYPSFQKGHWEFNNFRNGGTQVITADELTKIYANIPYVDSNGKTIIASITLADLYKSFGITSTELGIALRSDNRSLIYGKYIVARFIFNNDKKIKLQNVTFITNNY